MDKTPPTGRVTFPGEVLALISGYRLAHAVIMVYRTLPQTMANGAAFGKRFGRVTTP